MSPADMLPLAGVHGQSLGMLALLTLGAALTAVVAGLAVAAFVRRRSRPYLLVALALSTLVARTGLGLASYGAVVGLDLHHLLEHALDVVMAALVIAAVYLVGAQQRREAVAEQARADGGDPDRQRAGDGTVEDTDREAER